jgi:hypothetical protein
MEGLACFIGYLADYSDLLIIVFFDNFADAFATSLFFLGLF